MSYVECWLKYAARVVACKHLAECRRAGGDPDAGRTNSQVNARYRELRYPGYYGAEYAENGILCVAMVHNANELFKRQFPRAEQATYDWLESGSSDEEYLRVIQEVYSNDLPNWGPWKKDLGPAVKEVLGVSDDRTATKPVAYTNIAKCWTIPGRRKHGKPVDTEVMRICSEAAPIYKLVGILKPSIILVWGVTAPGGNMGLPAGEVFDRIYRIRARTTRRVNGEELTAGHTADNEAPDVWRSRAKAAYLRRQV